ncbi:MAG: ComEC family competence protein [Flavobacteriaceae bacterium]|nr:ComEC family competence protein [Flavobacteriaceae bacterium]
MRKLLEYLPFHFTICLVVGIILQFNFACWFLTGIESVILLVGLVGVLFIFNQFKKKTFFTVVSWLLFVFVGMFAAFTTNNVHRENYYQNHLSQEAPVTIKIVKELKSNLYYYKYFATVQKIGNKPTTGKILLHLQKVNAKGTLEVGDELLFTSEFLTVQLPLNPYQFNYKEYLEKQGIYHQVFLKEPLFLKRESQQFSLDVIANKVRYSIEKALLDYNFADEELAVIKALLLGQRTDISSELLQNYTNAGAIHILAVSGLHVGIILLILSFLLKPLERLKYGKATKALIIVLLLWCFAIVAGLSASVVRAVTMFTAVAIGMSFQRKTWLLHALVMSMFVLLLFKPLFLFDVGFQLSYLAVFSIIFFQPKIASTWKPNCWLATKFWQLFTVSLAAQIGVLPICLYYFNQFPGLFMLSNLVIIPFIGLILLGGIVVIFLALNNSLPSFLASAYNAVIAMMNSFVSWVSLQESFLITDISFSLTQMIITYIVIVFLGLYLEKKNFKRFVGMLFFVIVFQIQLFFEKHQVQTTEELIVFHKSRYTIIGIKQRDQLLLNHNLDTVAIKKLSLLKKYTTAKKIDTVMYKNNIPAILQYHEQQVLIVDKLGVYQLKDMITPIVLLTQSPKINLERLLLQLKPRLVIADGSNYKSRIANWKFICDTNNIPFYDTGKSGAFVLK